MPTPTPSSLKSAAININATTGENVIIAAVATAVITVYQLILIPDAATLLHFEDGAAGPDLDGQGFSMGINGQLSLPFTGEPWLKTTAGNALILDQSGTAHIGGLIYFTQA